MVSVAALVCRKFLFLILPLLIAASPLAAQAEPAGAPVADSPAAAVTSSVTTADSGSGADGSGNPAAQGAPIWLWSLGLFVFCFVLGVLGVMAGIGGGVLFVPFVAAFLPFHMDFVRATGLLIALAGALAASPGLLKRGLGNLRLMFPCALVGSIGSIIGAKVGLALPEQLTQVLLGICILGVALLILFSRKHETPQNQPGDRLAQWLRIGGFYREVSTGVSIQWQTRRTPLGLTAFLGVGFVAGMFGLGAGWANVPVFNLLMGVPLKVAVGSSVLMFSAVNTTAAWVYLNKGAWLPVLALPSIIGLVLGTSIGVKMLGRSRPQRIRQLVIVLLFIAAASTLLKGLGVWS